jgi:hypothetical protein
VVALLGKQNGFFVSLGTEHLGKFVLMGTGSPVLEKVSVDVKEAFVGVAVVDASTLPVADDSTWVGWGPKTSNVDKSPLLKVSTTRPTDATLRTEEVVVAASSGRQSVSRVDYGTCSGQLTSSLGS